MTRRYPSGSLGKRCYAIGDVHGRLDLLAPLIRKIEHHHRTRSPKPTSIVLLGDLIDRGPESSAVVEYVRSLKLPDINVFVVAGNHEELFLRTLGMEENAFHAWMRSGGKATARSYGVNIDALAGMDAPAIQTRLAAAVPPSHVAFLRACADSIGFGDYLLTHAGVRPGISLPDQVSEDLRWIRGSFLRSNADHGRVIIHGHSVALKIEELPNRIGIDTGAYRSGVLTAVWLEDDKRGFLQEIGREDHSVDT